MPDPRLWLRFIEDERFGCWHEVDGELNSAEEVEYIDAGAQEQSSGSGGGNAPGVRRRLTGKQKPVIDEAAEQEEDACAEWEFDKEVRQKLSDFRSGKFCFPQDLFPRDHGLRHSWQDEWACVCDVCRNALQRRRRSKCRFPQKSPLGFPRLETYSTCVLTDTQD